MKIALVVPESNLHFNNACAPLNLGYLASYLRKYVPNIEVRIFDGVAHKNIKEEVIQWHPDVVGLTATTPQAPATYELATSIKQKCNCFTIIGGVHATAMPEEAAKHCDCVVIGEGEKALANIIQKLQQNAPIPKIIEGQYVENLDDIPSPAFDLIDMRSYIEHGPPFPGLKAPIMSMVTSRGCPFRCPFCHNSFRNYPPRWFSAQRIVNEILFFINEYGIKSVFFNDDEFIVNKKRLKEVATLFEKHGINKRIVWGCQARVNSIDAETLRLVKSMGCVVISPGFESAAPRMLEFLKCGTTTIADNERALKIAEEVGITMGGSFIFGTPGETLDEMKQSFKWFEEHDDLKFIGINTVIPYPKTKIWEICQSKGLLPENMSYTKLIPTSTPKETYIVNNAVNPDIYNKFIVDIQRIAWILTQTRLDSSFKNFIKLAHAKTWWWMWIKHPHRMFKVAMKTSF